MTIPKKKLSEIAQRFKRLPAVREIYVEGLFDRDLYLCILANLGLNDVRVYPISTVEVSEDDLRRENLSNGERQKVQVAAKFFNANVDIHHRIVFLIDADLDYLLSRSECVPPLHNTAGTSAEMIIWKKTLLEKFFALALGCEFPKQLVQEMVAFIEPMVIAVCELRAAKELLQTNWKLLSIGDSFDKKNSFSFDLFCGKVADKNAARKEFATVVPVALKKVREISEKLEPAQKMHGHDLFAALARKLQLIGYQQRCLSNPDELSRLLMTALEWKHLENDKTVMKLSKILEACNVSTSAAS